MAFDIADLLKTILGAGLGSVIAQTSFAIWQNRTTRQNHGGYLAMRLAVTLESFAFSCAARVESNQCAQLRPGEQYPDWNVSIPALAEYPADLDGWRYLDRDLADRCLRLPNKIMGSGQTIEEVASADESELGDRANIEISDRGMEAWKLASDLMRRFDLSIVTQLEWDFSASLAQAGSKARSSIESRKRAREEVGRRLAEHWNDAYRDPSPT